MVFSPPQRPFRNGGRVIADNGRAAATTTTMIRQAIAAQHSQTCLNPGGYWSLTKRFSPSSQFGVHYSIEGKRPSESLRVCVATPDQQAENVSCTIRFIPL
jgi:hypothetical protein